MVLGGVVVDWSVGFLVQNVVLILSLSGYALLRNRPVPPSPSLSAVRPGVVGAGGDGIVFGYIYDETFRGYLPGWLLQLAVPL